MSSVQKKGSWVIPILRVSIFFPQGVDLIAQASADAMIALRLHLGAFDLPYPPPTMDIRDLSLYSC